MTSETKNNNGIDVICESCGYSVKVHGDIVTLKHCLEQVSLRLQRILKE